MNVSMSALRKPLALAAVTAVMFSAVACSGADPTSAPPPASNTSASEPAAKPTPKTSASPTESASATPSARPTTNTQGNDALLAAGGLGSKEVPKGTVVSIESERNGWEVHVVSAPGEEQQLRTDASGEQLVSGPTDDRPDTEDRAENQQFAQVSVSYKRAVRAVEGEVDGTEISDLSLDRDNGRTVWEADVVVGSQQRQIQIDADDGKIVSNRIDD